MHSGALVMGEPRRFRWGDLADSAFPDLDPEALSVAIELVTPEPFPDAFDGPTLASLTAGLEALAAASPGEPVRLLTLTMGESKTIDRTVVVFDKEDVLLSLSEVAGILDCSPDTVRRLLESDDNDLYGIRVTPGRIAVLRSALSEYLEALVEAARKPARASRPGGREGKTSDVTGVRIIPPPRRRRH